MALLAVMLAAVIGAWAVGRTTRATAQRVTVEQTAASHIAPAKQIVFDADPANARGLIRRGPHEPVRLPLINPEPADYELLQLPADLIPAALPDPGAYLDLRQSMGVATESLDDLGVLLFLHELSAPSGVRRIVVVRFLPWVLEEKAPEGWAAGMSAGLVAHVFEPGGWLGRPRHLGSSLAPLLLPQTLPQGATSYRGEIAPMLGGRLDPYRLVRQGKLRWYAGQPDITDPSHFTLDFESGGIRGTVDGYLSADGSSVHLHVRPPAADGDRSTETTGVNYRG